MRSRIALVTVGSMVRANLDIPFLEGWQSSLFKMHHFSTIQYAPDAEDSTGEYSDDQLERMIAPDADSAFTVAIVSAPLEQNYYTRRLPRNLVVISSFEIAEILERAKLRIELFVLRAAYVHRIYLLRRGRIPLTSEESFSHDETRGLLAHARQGASETPAAAFTSG